MEFLTFSVNDISQLPDLFVLKTDLKIINRLEYLQFLLKFRDSLLLE